MLATTATTGESLTITDNASVLPVVAVVDAPAWERAEVNPSLVPVTLHIVHPDGARPLPK